MASTRTVWTANVTQKYPEQQPRPAAVVVDALVERTQHSVEADPLEPGLGEAKKRTRRASEEQERKHDRPEHEDALDPEIRAHVEAPDRQEKRNRSEQNRRSAAKAPLQHDGSAGDGCLPRVATSGLDDAHRVTAERGRQDLPGGVSDEVGAGEPGEALVDPLCPQEPPPARGQHRHRQDHDRGRDCEPCEVGLGEHVERCVELDLPDEVGNRKCREHERAHDPRLPCHAVSADGASRGASSFVTLAAGVATRDRSTRDFKLAELGVVGMSGGA